MPSKISKLCGIRLIANALCGVLLRLAFPIAHCVMWDSFILSVSKYSFGVPMSLWSFFVAAIVSALRMSCIAFSRSKHALNAPLKNSKYLPSFLVNSARKACQTLRKRKGGKALICRTLPPNLLILNILLFVFQTALRRSETCDRNSEWRA